VGVQSKRLRPRPPTEESFVWYSLPCFSFDLRGQAMAAGAEVIMINGRSHFTSGDRPVDLQFAAAALEVDPRPSQHA